MIPYADPTDILQAGKKDLLITDGTVTVSGTNYSVAGATVTITNSILESEAFELHQSLCSESQIRFGACESGYVTFVVHENIAPTKGKVLKVYLIPDSDASKMLQLGGFKVEEDKLSADRTKRTITAYDALYEVINSDVAAWYNSELPNSSTTKTLAQFRADFLTHFGITAESTTLPNDSMTVTRTIEPETLSGADVIRAICEINGVFGQITNEGKFRYVVLTENLDAGLFPSDTLYPDDALYPQDINSSVSIIEKSGYIDVQFEDYMSEAITQLTIRENDSDVGTTVGTSGNRYIIQANFLTYGKNATQLTTIGTNTLTNMVNRSYRPCTVNAVGNPLHEVGDGIRVNSVYRAIVSYILERKLSGIQALRDTYMANGEEYFGEQLNNIGTQFKQLESKTTQLKIDTDGLQLYVEEQLDDTVVGSYAYVTATEIGTKVSTTDYNGNEIASRINQNSTTISIQAEKINLTGYVGINNGFSVDANGYVSMKSAGIDDAILYDCTMLTSAGGTVDVGNGAISVTNSGLELYGGGIYTNSSNYLVIDGYVSSGNYAFTNVAINAPAVHIGYQNTNTVDIWNCNRIRGQSSTKYIEINSNDIDLHSTSVVIGTSGSASVELKGKDCSWETVTIDGTQYTILTGA